ncbi:MAG TPA: PilX N-terminal domain-containing pilus assembly protein [Gammaproteobacteria bacterium]|nr:PilX N-terminal domain-containing pilus assembly protein [Gammaproteobacteria bacterium]
MNRTPSITGPHARERGVVLVITLILLLVLTLVGLAATTSTSLEEKMTANQRDTQIAFQAAEAALRNGESVLTQAAAGPFDNTKGMFNATTSSITDFVAYATDSTTVWDNTNSVVYSGDLDPAPDSAPRFFIVQTTMTTQSTGASLAADQPQVSTPIYMVFARGVGLSGKSVVVLETTFTSTN